MPEEYLGLRKIGEVFMISVYLYQSDNSFKVVLPLLEGFDNG